MSTHKSSKKKVLTASVKGSVNTTHKPKSQRKYGWKPDVPDHRDMKFKRPAHLTSNAVLPPSADIRQHCLPNTYDQGDLGSCTGNAIAGAHATVQSVEGSINVTPVSRLFVYWNERDAENTVATDSGAQIRDGFKVIGNYGAPAETLWPYDINQFTVKPDEVSFKDAVLHKALQYERLDNTVIGDLKACLAAGYPFVFGFSVYESFESNAVAETGKMPMPGPNESMLGGHAVMAVGYNDNLNCFIVRNSWGPDWGDKGYFYMPYEYITNPDLADDFWKLSQVA